MSKNLLDLISDIRAKQAAMKKLQQDMPRIIGVESVRILKDNFKKGGYDSGAGFTAWKKRSEDTNTAYDYNRTSAYRTPKLHKKSRYKNPYKGSVVSSKHPILVQTGNLRDALTYQINGKTVRIGVMPNIAKKKGALKDAHTYAEMMNEGGTGKWGKHSTSVPRRQFMPRPSDGPNPKILSAIKKKYESELDKFMKDWHK
jgi:hypothetical protein